MYDKTLSQLRLPQKLQSDQCHLFTIISGIVVPVVVGTNQYSLNRLLVYFVVLHMHTLIFFPTVYLEIELGSSLQVCRSGDHPL